MTWCGAGVEGCKISVDVCAQAGCGTCHARPGRWQELRGSGRISVYFRLDGRAV